MKKLITITILLILFSLLTNYGHGQIINVPIDQPTIQVGIFVANDGDTVLVAQGTYIENINYYGKAITVASHWLIDPDSAHIYNTIIDGSDPAFADFASVVTFLTAEDTTSVLCGFTICNGTGMYLSTDDARIGGGIVCYLASATIINNIIINNEVNYENHAWGGGIASIKESGNYWTIVEDNIIKNNLSNTVTGSASGGGIEIWGNARVHNNIIENNHCTSASGYAGGGGIVQTSVNNPADHMYFEGNTVRNNSATAMESYAYGGGFLADQSIIHINNCLFDSNQCEGHLESSGGGIRINGAIITLTNNTLRYNSVISNNQLALGGGMSSWYSENYITNNIFIYNTITAKTQADGGAIHFWHSGNTEVIDNVISYNQVYAEDYCLGAGIFCILADDKLDFSHNEFSYNSGPDAITGLGGGLTIYESFNNEIIINANNFNNNSVTSGGGLFSRSCYNIRVTNNLFTENQADRGGAIIFYHPAKLRINSSSFQGDYRPAIINNTFCSNSTTDHSAAIFFNCAVNIPVMFNCVFFENLAPEGNEIYYIAGEDQLFIAYSDLDTNNIWGSWTGEGNFYADPDFRKGDTLCHINGGSPCQNTGTESVEANGIVYLCPDHDYEEDPRPDPFGGPDIGADEVFYDGINKIHASRVKLHAFPVPSPGTVYLKFEIPDSFVVGQGNEYLISDIYSIHGTLIRHLLNEEVIVGEYEIKIDVKDLPAGIYFIKLQAGDVIETARIVVVD